VRVLKHFVIDEADFFIKNSAEQVAVIRLLLIGMAEEHIILPREKHLDGHFLNAQEHVAIAKIFLERYAGILVLLIGKSPDGAGLHGDFRLGILLENHPALRRGKGHAFIGRHLSLPDHSKFHSGIDFA
jgi:hypothetical protein